MKKTILVILVVIVVGGAGYTLLPLFINREVQEVSPIVKNTEVLSSKNTTATPSVKSKASVIAEANFVASAHNVKGKALLIKEGNKNIVRFENFETINGPDLRIYLSKDLTAKDYVDLGAIKANKGNINYDIILGTDISQYNKVLVWCRAFSVLFSYADLK